MGLWYKDMRKCRIFILSSNPIWDLMIEKNGFNMLCASEKGEVVLWFWIQCNNLQSFYSAPYLSTRRFNLGVVTFARRLLHGGSTSVLHYSRSIALLTYQHGG